jgi:hypothetical protein
VTTNNSADTEPYVFANAQSTGPNPLPAPLTLFPNSSISFSYQYEVVRSEEDTTKWFITVDYKTIFNQFELDRANYQDPTLRPARVSGQSRTIMQPVRTMPRIGPYNTYPTGTQTFNTVVAANSAGDPLDPPVEIALTEWEIHVTKNVTQMPTWFGTYNNGVNKANQTVVIQGANWTIPAGCGKLSNFTFSDLKQENGIDFIEIGWNCTVRLPRQKRSGETVAPSPWDSERLDEGTRVRSNFGGSNYYWANIRDQYGQNLTHPVPFSGNGGPATNSGAAILESQLQFYCYRPFGPQVDYSVMPWS